MLALTRRKNEQVVIGDNQVIVTVCSIKGDKVVLGFETNPKSIAIHRKEIYDAIISKPLEQTEQE